MPLPPNVKSKLQSSSHSIHQSVMLQSRQNILSAGTIVRHSAAKQVDEVGPEAARSIDKILALPMVAK
jgi:hypothetical protein